MMKWRLLFALIGLSITGVNSFAQSNQTLGETPQAEGLNPGRSPSQIGEQDVPEMDAGYLGPSGVVLFQLVQGRIVLDAPRHRKGSQSCRENGIYESVSVTAQRGIPSVHYVFQSDYQHLALSVQDGRSMQIESWLPDRAQRCVLTQPPSGLITMSCSDANQSHQWNGATLIHIREQHAALFDDHFGRLTTRMLNGESLKKLSKQTKLAVIAELQRPSRISEAEIHRWIDDLGSDKRRLRIEAQRKLISGGTLVVPAVRDRIATNVKRHDLGDEQLARLDRILNQLRSRSPDRPRSLAKLLVNDRSYWSVVADSLSSDQQRLASSWQQNYRQRSESAHSVTHIAGR
jgi:hypothetical protein